jgi:hypothetical protein
MAVIGDENVLVAIYEDSHSDQQITSTICSFVGLQRSIWPPFPGRRRVQVISNMPKNHRLARCSRRKDFAPKKVVRFGPFLNPATTSAPTGEQWPPLDTSHVRLRDQFRPQIEDLEALLQRDLSMEFGKLNHAPAPEDGPARMVWPAAPRRIRPPRRGALRSSVTTAE